MTETLEILRRRQVSVLTVPDYLAAEECQRFIALTEQLGFEDAPLTTRRGFVMCPEVRNNTRVMLDDPSLAQELWARMQPFVPPHMPSEEGTWRAVGLNERFRFYRYDEGQYFRYHSDGAFIRSPEERSLLTAMVYLNDGFGGGTTDFDDGPSVVPCRGMLLVFEHSLLHQGAPVRRGRKYVLRTDIMYRL